MLANDVFLSSFTILQFCHSDIGAEQVFIDSVRVISLRLLLNWIAFLRLRMLEVAIVNF